MAPPVWSSEPGSTGPRHPRTRVDRGRTTENGSFHTTASNASPLALDLQVYIPSEKVGQGWVWRVQIPSEEVLGGVGLVWQGSGEANGQLASHERTWVNPWVKPTWGCVFCMLAFFVPGFDIKSPSICQVCLPAWLSGGVARRVLQAAPGNPGPLGSLRCREERVI